MNILKKIVAAALVCLMALTVIGCHPKDEIAVTIDGHEYTSAYYMCALITAYMEGQEEIYNNLSEEETSSSDIDFFSKKIGEKSFSDWVKDRAIETLKEVSIYKSLCRDNKLELTDEERANAEYYASFYWSSYGYSELFEPNGVSQATYTNYMLDGGYANLYFEHLYGKGGEKEIAAKDVETKLYSDFLIANLLEVTFSDETDAQKTEIKNKFDEYQKNLKNRKMTFEEVYIDYNEDKDHKHEETEGGPKDPHATVIGKEGTGYEHDSFSDIEKMKTGEIKLIEKENSAGLLLVVKQDIKADGYYLEDMDMTIRQLLKNEEFTQDMTKQAEKLEAEINKYAINQFKVKNIKEPQY